MNKRNYFMALGRAGLQPRCLRGHASAGEKGANRLRSPIRRKREGVNIILDEKLCPE
jgi:hypothetical protein